MKVVAFAGGVGGAKFADGLAQVLKPGELTIVVNTGDDFEHFGLTICPDLDTVCYTLAGLANQETGWGRVGDSWDALKSVERLGGPAWFWLGDRDLGTHLERTRRLKAGDSLSKIAVDFCRAWGVREWVLPMSDDPVRTMVNTDEGELGFQQYFVQRNCEPRVRGFRFAGVEKASPTPIVMSAIKEADLILLCPSNPWVSIAPILALNGISEALTNKAVFAISPLIGGKAVKGPAAKMYTELGIEPSSLAVAKHYGKLLNGFVIDKADSQDSKAITELGIMPFVTDALMRDRADRKRLAAEVLEFGSKLISNR
jgi:LPPG:FO 2-phospho-L-lactate transferase